MLAKLSPRYQKERRKQKHTQQQLEEIVLIAHPRSLVGQAGARKHLVQLGLDYQVHLGLGVLAGCLGVLGVGVVLLLEEDGHVLFFVLLHGFDVVVLLIIVVFVVIVHLDVHGIVGGGAGGGNIGGGGEGLVDGDVVEGAVDFVVLNVKWSACFHK